MNWIVLVTGVVLAICVAINLAAYAAAIVGSFSNPKTRKWSVILSFTLAMVVVGLFCAASFSSPNFWGLKLSELHDAYRALPSITLQLVSAGIAFAASLIASAGFAFWPLRNEPYRPRASHWNFARQHRLVAIAALVLVLAMAIQDVELRWRLARMEDRAIELAETLTPATVPKGKNSAVYYQQIIDEAIRVPPIDEEFKQAALGLDICECSTQQRDQWKEKYEKLLSHFAQAANRQLCAFDGEYKPVDLLDEMEFTGKLMGSAQVLPMLSRRQICMQRPVEAIAYLRLLRVLEEHLIHDPRGLQPVFLFWLDAWICHTVEQLVTFCESLPAHEIQTLFAEPFDADAIHRSASTWQAAVFQMHIAKTYDGRNYDKPDMQGKLPANRVLRALLLTIMRMAYARDDIDSMNAYFPFMDHPESAEAWSERDFLCESTVFPTGYLLHSLESDSWSKHWVVRANEWRQLANIGLAAGLYRQQHQRWPESLEQLETDYLPESVKDFTTEGRFFFKNVDGGLIVYSPRDARKFEAFRDDEESWVDISESYIESTIYLGEAYRKFETAKYANPDDPCAGERNGRSRIIDN